MRRPTPAPRTRPEGRRPGPALSPFAVEKSQRRGRLSRFAAEKSQRRGRLSRFAAEKSRRRGRLSRFAVKTVSYTHLQETDQRRANARLGQLPMEKQMMIADKYFSGEMPWRGEME